MKSIVAGNLEFQIKASIPKFFMLNVSLQTAHFEPLRFFSTPLRQFLGGTQYECPHGRALGSVNGSAQIVHSIGLKSGKFLLVILISIQEITVTSAIVQKSAWLNSNFRSIKPEKACTPSLLNLRNVPLAS